LFAHSPRPITFSQTGNTLRAAWNPTLTAQALAWRTADYLVKNWKKVSET
jgi:hypothetical protein